jgi:hypothetical protein
LILALLTFNKAFWLHIATEKKEFGDFSLNFGQILAVEKVSKKQLILALLSFNIAFWLHITRKKEFWRFFIIFCQKSGC